MNALLEAFLCKCYARVTAGHNFFRDDPSCALGVKIFARPLVHEKLWKVISVLLRTILLDMNIHLTRWAVQKQKKIGGKVIVSSFAGSARDFFIQIQLFRWHEFAGA